MNKDFTCGELHVKHKAHRVHAQTGTGFDMNPMCLHNLLDERSFA